LAQPAGEKLICPHIAKMPIWHPLGIVSLMRSFLYREKVNIIGRANKRDVATTKKTTTLNPDFLSI
jgi:hypothetical protein